MMHYATIRNLTRDCVVAAECGLADNFWLRLRGLLGRPPLTAGEGLLITPCRAVHMMGMKYPIDVAFLDRGGRIVAIEADLPPGAKSRWHASARHALELPAGSLAASGTEAGDNLSIEPLTSRATAEHHEAVGSDERISGAA